MRRRRFILLINVLGLYILVAIISFGAYQNQSPLISGQYFPNNLRNGGFISEDVEAEVILIEDELVSVAIGVNKEMDNKKMDTQNKGTKICVHAL